MTESPFISVMILLFLRSSPESVPEVVDTVEDEVLEYVDNGLAVLSISGCGPDQSIGEGVTTLFPRLNL